MNLYENTFQTQAKQIPILLIGTNLKSFLESGMLAKSG